MGLVLVSAQNGDRNITLPATTTVGTRDVLVQRLDNSGNRLTIRASGTERILFHTHLTPYGYPFFVLMGAGDWWHLRSDGKGVWWPVGRYDNTPLGQPVMETTISFPPGGYGAANGAVLIRTEWPWLWDHAQQSGMLIQGDQAAFKDGCWRIDNSELTFRLPEIRGEFLRVLDESRGVDIGRDPGTVQSQEIQAHSHVTAINMDFGGSGAGNAVCGDENHYGVGVYGSRSTGGAETRPRNVAFPGRIKVI
jgi:hypothetical protein